MPAVVYAQQMNRRRFLASLAGVAIVPALPPIAPSTSAFDEDLATLTRDAHQLVAQMDALNRRPVLQCDELSRYIAALTREQHARLNQRSLNPVTALRKRKKKR